MQFGTHSVLGCMLLGNLNCCQLFQGVIYLLLGSHNVRRSDFDFNFLAPRNISYQVKNGVSVTSGDWSQIFTFSQNSIGNFGILACLRYWFVAKENQNGYEIAMIVNIYNFNCSKYWGSELTRADCCLVKSSEVFAQQSDSLAREGVGSTGVDE